MPKALPKRDPTRPRAVGVAGPAGALFALVVLELLDSLTSSFASITSITATGVGVTSTLASEMVGAGVAACISMGSTLLESIEVGALAAAGLKGFRPAPASLNSYQTRYWGEKTRTYLMKYVLQYIPSKGKPTRTPK